MRFSLKVQSIGATNQNTKGYIAITHEFEVFDEQALSKRGRLFITLNISSSENFDLKEASSLFIDSLQESFYRINDETPLHAIEASLKRAYQLLLSIKSEKGDDVLGSARSAFNISCAIALVWNRVLYTSHIGSPAIYLIRGTGARDLVLEKGSHEIWTNSNIIENEDVVIIGTEMFARIFPSSEIINNLGSLSSTIEAHPESNKISAVLIKASATKEIQTTSITEKVKAINIGHSISGTIWKVKSKISGSQALSERFKLYQSKKAAPVSSITGLSDKSQTLIENQANGPRRINERKSTQKGKKQIAVGLIMLVGIGFANYKLFYEKKSSINEIDTNNIAFDISKYGAGDVKGESDATSEINLHKEIVKFSEIEENTLPTSMTTIRKNLVILDSTNEFAYKVNLADKSISKIESTLGAPKLIKCQIHMSTGKDICFLYGKDGFIVFDANKKENEIDKYFADIDNLVDIYPYSDTLYILTSDSVYTYQLETTEPKKWLKGEVLSNTKSIAVDSNVYILSSNDVYKYANGKLVTSFKLDKSKLENPSQIEITETSVLVLDQKKIVLFKKSNGEFEKEVKLAEDTDQETPTSFSLTKDEIQKIVFEKGKSFFIVEE